MNFFAPTLFAAIAATPALAQDMVFSMDATLACLDQANLRQDKVACIGAAASQCIDENEGGSGTTGMSDCLNEELQYWKKRMDESYASGLAHQAAFDAEHNAGGTRESTMAEKFEAMHAAWVPFSVAACNYEVGQWGDGTGALPAAVGCEMHMTAEQTLLIEDFDN